MLPRELFQKVLELDPGDTIAVPCGSFEEMETLRVAFYRERKKLSEVSPQAADGISISRVQTTDGDYFVYLKKMTDIPTALVIKADGSIKPLMQIPKVDELERIVCAMRLDGMTEEDIDKAREEFLAECQ
jgi:ADP-ribose pyrophosphatase YjhB (NUDIX family)